MAIIPTKHAIIAQKQITIHFISISFFLIMLFPLNFFGPPFASFLFLLFPPPNPNIPFKCTPIIRAYLNASHNAALYNSFQKMSLPRHSMISTRTFYHIYLQNLPDKYAHSDIFPDVLLSQEIKDDVIEQEVQRQECYCMLSFKSKQVALKFQKNMMGLMPAFVLITRRKEAVPLEMKQEKEYFDSRYPSLSNQSMEVENTARKKIDQHTVRQLDTFSKKWLGMSYLFGSGKLLGNLWKKRENTD